MRDRSSQLLDQPLVVETTPGVERQCDPDAAPPRAPSIVCQTFPWNAVFRIVIVGVRLRVRPCFAAGYREKAP